MEIKKQTNLRGTLMVPGDKSISHRAVMFGSLAKGTTQYFTFSGRCRLSLDNLPASAKWVLISNEMLTEILVHGKGLHGLICSGLGSWM